MIYSMLTNEMKCYVVFVGLKVDQGDLEIECFLRFARSFVNKVPKMLEKENDNQNVKKSTCFYSLRTPEFNQKVKQTVDENRGQSMRSISKKLHMTEKIIRRNVHKDIRYKSYVMKRGQFIYEKSKENN